MKAIHMPEQNQFKPEWDLCDRCTDPMDCGSWACCMNQSSRPAAKGVEIDPQAADLRIEVDERGVYIGFFTEDGRSALLNLDEKSCGEHSGFLSSPALRAWVADRRKQAARIAG